MAMNAGYGNKFGAWLDHCPKETMGIKMDYVNWFVVSITSNYFRLYNSVYNQHELT